MLRPIRILRNAVFLGWLSLSLLGATIAMATWAVSLTVQVTAMTTTAAATAVRHRKDIAKAVARTKAKGRLRRVVVAVPFVGVAAAVAFEAQDYSQWQDENPGKTSGDYSCEVATLSAEVVDEVLEVLQELPERVRPRSEVVLGRLPQCEEGAE